MKQPMFKLMECLYCKKKIDGGKFCHDCLKVLGFKKRRKNKRCNTIKFK